MNQRVTAALIGTTLGLATFAGSTLAVSAATPEPPSTVQDDGSKAICDLLKALNLTTVPQLADVVKKLGCDSTSPTSSSSSAPGQGR